MVGAIEITLTTWSEGMGSDHVVGGDVVYTVLVELDEQPAGLRWGMTVEVNIETTTPKSGV